MLMTFCVGQAGISRTSIFYMCNSVYIEGFYEFRKELGAHIVQER